MPTLCIWRAGYRSLYSDWLRAGRSGDQIPVGARFPAPVQADPGAHPASCTMGTGSFPGGKSGRGVAQTPHLLLMPWSWKGKATCISLLPLWAVRPVQRLSARTKVHFTFYLCIWHEMCLFETHLCPSKCEHSARNPGNVHKNANKSACYCLAANEIRLDKLF